MSYSTNHSELCKSCQPNNQSRCHTSVSDQISI